ncbi:tetratricopeptide repeat protein [bacterium]|nr:tetratricopeptide repeat protein [bacterium]
MIHASATSFVDGPTSQTRHARYDTVDSPLPAFRIPLHSSARPIRIDENVIQAGAKSVASDNVPAPLATTGQRMVPGGSIVKVSDAPHVGTAPLLVPTNPVEKDVEPLPWPAEAKKANVEIENPTLPTKSLSTSLPKPTSPAQKPTREESSSRWPTLIYRSTAVILAVPDDLVNSVWTVRLKKLSGVGTGAELAAPVEQGKASFRGLTEGAFDVEYVGGTKESGRRRIMIELEPPPEPISFSLPEKISELRSPVAVTDEGLVQEIEVIWDRLERGATFSSLRRFQEIVESYAKIAGPDQEMFDIIRVMSGQVSLETLEKSGRCTRENLAKIWADQLGHRADLANALFGIGRAYEMIESDPRPTLAEAGRMAEVCYQTAHLLDGSLPGPLRDLGLRLQDRGLDQDAGDCFEEAARSAPDAETLLSLGQWYLQRQRKREATAAFEEAHRLDPTFLPALLERARWSVVPATGAIYPSELHELTQGLEQLAGSKDVSPADRRWALQQSQRLAWMEREAEDNLAGVSVRRLSSKSRTAIPHAESNSLISSIVARRSTDAPRSIPKASSSSKMVSQALARGKSTESVSVRPVASQDARGNLPSVVPSGGLMSPPPTNSIEPPPPASIAIPRANDATSTNPRSNLGPMRIPQAVPRDRSPLAEGAQP